MTDTRSGEGGAWKLLRLWPMAVVIATVIAGYAALNTSVGVLADGVDENKDHVRENRQEIEILKQQSVRVEEQMKRVDEKLQDQRHTLQRILEAVRPVRRFNEQE